MFGHVFDAFSCVLKCSQSFQKVLLSSIRFGDHPMHSVVFLIGFEFLERFMSDQRHSPTFWRVLRCFHNF